MKQIRFILILNILFANVYIANGQSSIRFVKRTFNFGQIALEDGTAHACFNFKSVGRDYLMIKNALADSNDVTVTWEKRLYQRGKEGIITVGFEPKNEGIFKRKITVETNGKQRKSFILTITGKVIKTGKEPAVKSQHNIQVRKTSNPTTFKMPSAYSNYNKQRISSGTNTLIASQNAEGQTVFPVTEHGFALTSRIIDFHKINKGDKPTVSIKIKNNTDETRDIYFAPLFEYIEYKATPKTLQAGEEGEISLTFDSKKCPIWGAYQAEFILITEAGSTSKNSPVLFFKVDIVEDFNSFTEEEKRIAPRAAFETTLIDLGKIDNKSKQKITFKFSNKGESPFQIRKIIPTNNFNIVHCDGKVSSGAIGVLELELNTANLKAGLYSDKIILQTNDPQNPKMELKVNWSI